jgi:hypothetical protein
LRGSPDRQHRRTASSQAVPATAEPITDRLRPPCRRGHGDYSENNPFHRSRAQVKDGVLCRDAADPDHFYLIGEWADIEEHRRIRELVAREIKPEFVQLIEGGHFVLTYAQIVSTI